MGHLKWYAAFHNASHHPHVHLMVYSTVPGEGHLSKQGVEKMRSAFAKDIFTQDLVSIYQKQAQIRDELRHDSRERMAEIVASINAGGYENEVVKELIAHLALRLSRTSAKKVYGYLNADIKRIVDQIVAELAKDSQIQELYDLWYEQREDVLRTYTDTFPERIPLEQNPEFKTIRNAVIQEALKATPELEVSALVTTVFSVEKPPSKEDGDEDKSDDFHTLHPYPGQGDLPPEQPHTEPIYEPLKVKNYVPARNATVSLLRSLARMIQDRSEQEQKPRKAADRKQWQKEQDKKQAMGIKD